MVERDLAVGALPRQRYESWDGTTLDGPRRFLRRVRRFYGAEDGPTSAEYTVVLALIVLVGMAGARVMGCGVQQSFSNTANSISF
ncbi:MAG: hypothetical protein DWQ37_19725 [Planctomycetota bacterium]|mgnify:CR=1 FL=1|nr:MAG: hypothetical protein DWQ37_19725 [Planctomycetota bacterium]